MIVNTYVIPHLGGYRLQKLVPSDLSNYYADLLEEGKKDGSGLSRRTVRYAHTLIKKSLRDAMADGLVTRNAADGAKPPSKDESQAVKAWDLAELKTFLASTESDRFYPLWFLSLNTGMRRGEIAGLRWRDVDLDASTLRVVVTRVALADYSVVDSGTKTGKGRVINLDPQTVAVLRKWKRAQLSERLLWGSAWVDSGLVFTKENGAPLHPGYISDAFDKRVKKAGVTRIVFHGTRHTHATMWLVAGEPIKVLSERLGHSDIKITLQTYQHVLPGMQADSAAKVASLLA